MSFYDVRLGADCCESPVAGPHSPTLILFVGTERQQYHGLVANHTNMPTTSYKLPLGEHVPSEYIISTSTVHIHGHVPVLVATRTRVVHMYRYPGTVCTVNEKRRNPSKMVRIHLCTKVLYLPQYFPIYSKLFLNYIRQHKPHQLLSYLLKY